MTQLEPTWRFGAESALNLIRIGVILVRRDHTIAFANTAGAAQLSLQDGLTVDGRTLSATDPASQARLTDRIEAAFAHTGPERRWAVAVTRDPGVPGLQVTVVSAHGTPPVAAILVTDPVADISAAAPRLRELYGLTDGESSVAILIAAGHDLASAAAQRQVSRETIRWLLRRCFEKTGVRRQLDLTRLVLACVPTLPAETLAEG